MSKYHSKHNKKNQKTSSAPLVLSGALTSLAVLSGLVLSSPTSSAESSGTVNLSVEIPAACSLTVASPNLSTTINPGNSGQIGTYSTITSICNDPAGLAVYAVGFTNDSYGNNTLASAVGSNTYTIPSATNNSPTDSQWNMTIAKVTGTYEPDIVTTLPQVIPTQYTKVAYRNSMTDIGTGASGASFTATFNAYVSSTQAAGTYQGKVKFLLVHPNVLTWEEDSQNPGTMVPDEVQPNTLPSDPEAPTCDANSPILQNVATWGSSVPLEEDFFAYDSRDNQCYKVKRLKMNAAGTETALWMSNLNLGAQTLTVTQLDNTNTHLASGVSPIPASTFTTWIKTSGTDSWTSPELIPVSGQDSYGNKYGALYNYAAASAGAYIYPYGSGTGNATSDLCPAGWRLPTGGSNGELKQLTIDGYNVYDTTNEQWNTNGFTTMESTLGFSRAGSFDSEAPGGQGGGGIYWSSTFGNDSGMHDLFYVEYYLSTDSYNGRGGGSSVRCIAQ